VSSSAPPSAVEPSLADAPEAPHAGAAYRVGADFREDHVLADGRKITLRTIQPDDGDALREAFARLSPTSRYRRFLVGMSELTDDMVRYLTHCDGENHVAVVATADSLDLKSDVGLGVARFIRSNEDPTVAEGAVTVIDEAQGKGIGRLLLRAIAEAARERGIRTLRAEVLASNEPMRRLLGEAGAVVRSDDGTTLIFDAPLEWHDRPLDGEEDRDRDHPLRRLLRAIAASFAPLRAGG
jgi:GNAT superfamily N-acetyltransferase